MASEDEKGPIATASTRPATEETSHQSNTMATIEDDDERLLAQIGYKQV